MRTYSTIYDELLEVCTAYECLELLAEKAQGKQVNVKIFYECINDVYDKLKNLQAELHLAFLLEGGQPAGNFERIERVIQESACIQAKRILP